MWSALLLPAFAFVQQDAPAEALQHFRDRVAPILRANCVECHNPDQSKGEFDLSTREALLFEGEYGAWVVPGSAEDSELMVLIDHADKPYMPKDKPQLSRQDRQAIRDWIDAGAHYDGPIAEQGGYQITAADRDHWAFRELAEASDRSIDDFILDRLAASDLALSEQAEPRQLLRRLRYDLTGLPPSAEEAAHFLLAWQSDPERAYREAVERLLASPEYGERWGRHWLDAARYADSGGYEFDLERPNAWPYRDWVIESYNADLPYDEFLRLQIAGDELRPGDPDAHRATGFLTSGPTVGNQETEQNRYDELDDMISTMGSAMLGVTLGCARCHDHKFDPIPQRDYYAMLAAFVGTERRQHPLLQPEAWQAYQAQLGEAETQIEQARVAYQAWQRKTDEAIVHRRLGRLELTEEAAQLLVAEQDPDAPLWRYTLRDPGAGWQQTDFDATDWPQGRPGFGAEGTPGARVGTAWTTEQIWLRRDFEWTGQHWANPGLAVHHDEAVQVYLNGEAIFANEGYLTDYQFFALDPAQLALLKNGTNTLAVHCSQSVGGQYVDVHLIDRSRLAVGLPLGDAVFVSEWQTLREQYGETLEVTAAQRSAEATAEELGQGSVLEAALEKAKALRPPAPQTALSIADKSAELQTNWLLGRGSPLDKREELPLGFLQVMGPANPIAAGFPVRARADGRSSGQRTSLAEWMTDVERGAGRLVARVEANRIWQHHFGRGLVATPGDFGRMADPPTHPQLLDALARRLIDSGWSRKALHREILMSHTYRQGGKRTPELAEIDADNRLWSYRPPLRLEAEAIRDSLLKVSGSLNSEMGGPGVRPWIHPDAIATGSTEKWPKNVIDSAATWRRTVYVFQRRSVMMPTLETFDLPNAAQSCTRRDSTTTPTQALAMLNNPFVRDQAKRFAQRVRDECGATAEPRDWIQRAFQITLNRDPSAAEQQASLRFLEEQALHDYCQVLINLNEFLYRP